MKIIRLAVAIFVFLQSYAYAGKKALIWDDTETLGTSNSQNENYFFYTDNLGEKEGSYIFNFTYGYNDLTDVAINIPVGYLESYENTYSDMADPFVEVKYRFFDKNGVKFAIKPYLGYPIKKHSEFSEHHISYGITLISQIDLEQFRMYANSSYMVHKDRPLGEYEIFQSLSIEYNFTENFSVISSLYISSYGETEKGGLIGIGYSKGKVEIGLGIGKMFNLENNYSIYSGITFRFF
ncbi:MAG: transporter [Hydrogenothermaceae bacterium]|nr:transporter [Hydrogenothermaceae bacterium]